MQLFAPVFPVGKEEFFSLHFYTHHILGGILTLAVLNLIEVEICDLKLHLSLGRQRRLSRFVWKQCRYNQDPAALKCATIK